MSVRGSGATTIRAAGMLSALNEDVTAQLDEELIDEAHRRQISVVGFETDELQTRRCAGEAGLSGGKRYGDRAVFWAEPNDRGQDGRRAGTTHHDPRATVSIRR